MALAANDQTKNLLPSSCTLDDRIQTIAVGISSRFMGLLNLKCSLFVYAS